MIGIELDRSSTTTTTTTTTNTTTTTTTVASSSCCCVVIIMVMTTRLRQCRRALLDAPLHHLLGHLLLFRSARAPY
jgi:hypothetical protein